MAFRKKGRKQKMSTRKGGKYPIYPNGSRI